MLKTFKLKEISLSIGSGITPSRSNENYWLNGTIPWLKTEQLGEHKIYSTTEKITKLALKETSIKIFPVDTLSIAMYGEGKTRGNISILKTAMATNQACCNVIIDKQKSDYEYVYYYLKTKYIQLRQLSSGVRKNLNSNDIKEFEVKLPDLETQQKIAAVLSSLDSKIELNNKINSELEAMAKTLYDYWFVQFDFPDSDGKPYKTSGGKMVWNDELKREIPDGWEVSSLKDIVELVKGNVNPSDIKQNTPYVGLEHIGRKTIVLSDWANSELANSEKTAFKKHDILFGKIRPYFHKVAVATFDGITSTDTIILRPKENIYFGLALQIVFTDKFIEIATQSSTGSKMPRADWNVLQDYKFPIPKSDLLKPFQNIFESALNKIGISVIENQTLSELRDWLLPMLMNGQVKV
jgi:type I restriction enzyme S subunit